MNTTHQKEPLSWPRPDQSQYPILNTVIGPEIGVQPKHINKSPFLEVIFSDIKREKYPDFWSSLM